MTQNSRKSKLFAELRTQERQRNKIFFVVIGILLVLATGWIIFESQTKSIPTALSLQDKWETLETSAHSWESDSYLTHVTFEISGQKPIQINAEYHSPTVPDQILAVIIDSFGKVKIVPLPLSSGSSGAQKPIYRHDWVIDSQKALSIFAEDKIVNSCLQTSSAPIEMSLNRVVSETPAWELMIVNCPDDGKYVSYYLNAQNGELFDPFK